MPDHLTGRGRARLGHRPPTLPPRSPTGGADRVSAAPPRVEDARVAIGNAKEAPMASEPSLVARWPAWARQPKCEV